MRTSPKISSRTPLTFTITTSGPGGRGSGPPRGHMNVALRRYHALLDPDRALFTFDVDPRRALQVPGIADGGVDAELELLGPETSTWVSFRRGPRIRTFSIRPLGPTRFTISTAANLSRLAQLCTRRQISAGAKRMSKSARLDGHGGPMWKGDAPERNFSTVSCVTTRPWAWTVSRAIIRSSSAGTTRIRTLEAGWRCRRVAPAPPGSSGSHRPPGRCRASPVPGTPGTGSPVSFPRCRR